MKEPLPFKVKTLYQRSKIHEKYKGQTMSATNSMFSGISTPAEGPYIFLFAQNHDSSGASLKCGYKDGWTKDKSTFFFTASGQTGDQSLHYAPNRSLTTHAQNGKRLLLFSFTGVNGYWMFEAEMEYAGFYKETGKDKDGNEREIIVFTLRPVTTPIPYDQLQIEWQNRPLKSSLDSPLTSSLDAPLKSSLGSPYISPPGSPSNNSAGLVPHKPTESSRKRDREEDEVPNQPTSKRKFKFLSNKKQFMKIMNATDDKQSVVPETSTSAPVSSPKRKAETTIAKKKFDLDDLLGSMDKHMNDLFQR